MGTLPEAVVQGLLIGAVYAAITFGLAVIHNVSGVLNFAHGHLVVLSMYFALALHTALGMDPYLAVLVIAPVMFGLGAVLYQLIFRRLTGSHVLTVIQVTLGIMFVIESVLLMTQGGQYQRVPSIVDGEVVAIAGVNVEVSKLIAFAASMLLAGGLFWVLGRTDFGRQVRAIKQNARAARLVGVNVERVRLIAFGAGIALAAIAGVLLVPGAELHPSEGLNFTVIAIMAFFIGGMGNFLGTLCAALLLGIAESLGAVYLPGAIGFTLPYVLVVLAIIFRPAGLFGGRLT